MMDIYNCVKEKDKKDWNDFMTGLYKRYVIKVQDQNNNIKKGKIEYFQAGKKWSNKLYIQKNPLKISKILLQKKLLGEKVKLIKKPSRTPG